MSGLTEPQRLELAALVTGLDPLLARAELPLAKPAIHVVRIRGALGLGASAASPIVRCIEAMDHADWDADRIDAALTALSPDQARILLRMFEEEVLPEHALVFADLLEVRGHIPGSRVAGLLALQDPDRCDAIVQRTRQRGPMPYVEAITAAALARIDAGLSLWPTLADAWTTVLADASATQSEAISAQLRMRARTDAVGALSLLEDAIDQVGAAEIPHAIEDVVSRAVLVDRDRTWRLSSRVASWVDQRALVVEALTVADPTANELEGEIGAVLATWKAGGLRVDTSPMGATLVFVPLIGAAAVAGRLDLARLLVTTFGPTLRQVAECTVDGARQRFVREDRWQPDDFAAMVPSPLPIGDLAMNPFLGPPMLSDEEIVGLWKVETALDLMPANAL